MKTDACVEQRGRVGLKEHSRWKTATRRSLARSDKNVYATRGYVGSPSGSLRLKHVVKRVETARCVRSFTWQWPHSNGRCARASAFGLLFMYLLCAPSAHTFQGPDLH